MLFPYLSRFRNYTRKQGKLQAENILDILQIKQVRNEIYKRTKSERKALFFRILLFIDLMKLCNYEDYIRLCSCCSFYCVIVIMHVARVMCVYHQTYNFLIKP